MLIREKIVTRTSKAGLSLPVQVVERLHGYFELLRRWNRKVSLTSLPVEDAGDEAIDRLLVEPVIAAHYIPAREAAILDIGSGGGSPAIPMRLATPGGTLRMVESKTRKAAFLREAIRVLNLESAYVDAVRSEELLSRPHLHDAFDIVSVRAVRIEPHTLAVLQSFAKPGGLLFLFGTAKTTITGMAGNGLALVAKHDLVPERGSTLQILQKRANTGRSGPNCVPRGTLWKP